MGRGKSARTRAGRLAECVRPNHRLGTATCSPADAGNFIISHGSTAGPNAGKIAELSSMPSRWWCWLNSNMHTSRFILSRGIHHRHRSRRGQRGTYLHALLTAQSLTLSCLAPQRSVLNHLGVGTHLVRRATLLRKRSTRCQRRLPTRVHAQTIGQASLAL